MPRQRRLWEPGDILHVVARGHEGRPLFATDDDRRFFVDRLRRVFVAEDVDLHAWALPINHYHLLFRVTRQSPETLFRRLNTALGKRERRLRGDHGAVLQGRYWSGVCDEEGAVLAALTYVLGNPVHHGAVPTAAALESYAWSAYSELVGGAAPGVVDVGRTLALLHADQATARSILRDAMASRVARWQSERAGIDVCEEPGCRGEGDGCRLVHPDRRRRASCEEIPAPSPVAWRPRGVDPVHDERSDRSARLRSAGWRPQELLAPVSVRLGADPAAVLAGGRSSAECAARAVIAHVACDGVGIPAATIAELLRVSGPAICVARRRGRIVLEAHGWTVDDALAWPGRTA